MLKRKDEQGFTLLEIALVLIIASLIVLGVIKARGVWNEAKYFRLERQVQELEVASALFERKMGYLPGADPAVTPTEIENSAGPNNAQDWSVDLAEQNLVISAVKAEIHPFNDSVWLEYITTGSPWGGAPTNLNIFVYANIPIEWAESLTLALDDGQPGTGSIRSTDPESLVNIGAWGGFTGDLVDVWVLLN